MVYASQKDYDRSTALLVQAARLQPDNPDIYYNVAGLYAMQNKKADALQWLEAAFKKGYSNCRLARTDKDLDSVRPPAGYLALMDRYCP